MFFHMFYHYILKHTACRTQLHGKDHETTSLDNVHIVIPRRKCKGDLRGMVADCHLTLYFTCMSVA